MYFLIDSIDSREPDGHLVSGTLINEDTKIRIWDVASVAITEEERALLEALESRIGVRLTLDFAEIADHARLRPD